MDFETWTGEFARVGRFGLQAAGYIVITFVAGLLILAWLSTAVLFRWGTSLKESYHMRSNPKPKMKGQL
jgi:hypothetical protein